MANWLRKVLRSSLPDGDVSQRPTYVIINHRSGGFFAQLNWCLYLFAHAQKKNCAIRPMLISRNYSSSRFHPNWFSDYFEFKHGAGQGIPRFFYIEDFRELNFQITPDLSLQEAHDIFFTNVGIRANVVDEVDDFVSRQFGTTPVVGVHYRGTDKSGEAARVDYEDAIERARRAAIDLGTSRIFVSTDEWAFLDAITRALTGFDIVARGNSKRSSNGQPVHLKRQGADSARLGQDALVNALLLSRCTRLVRTSSFLSAWSAIFNPDIEIELLNVPHSATLYYPEREIMRVLGVAGRGGAI